MSRVKTVPVAVESFVDTHTGEVVGQKVITRDVLVKDNEEWFSCFRRLAQSLLNLDGNEVKVLIWCAIGATVGTNEIVLARFIKERMAAETGLSMGGIDNALGRLVKKGHLHRLGRGVYHIDPETTWRGDLKSRAKSIQIYLNYTVQNP